MNEYIEHIIKAQKYEITLEKEEDAHGVQSQISVLQESQINGVLDAVLSRFSNPDYIYQFDAVELDLGVISKTNYESQLVLRIEEELIKFFTANFRENGTLRNGKVILLNDHKLDHFEHFILKGYLNWDSSLSQSYTILLKELIAENTDGLESLLKEHGNKELVRRRLIYQFDDEALESIVEVLANTESTYIISYKYNMLEQQKEQQFIETEFTDFRNVVWEVILVYLLVESSGYYNKKSFLHHLLSKTAKKYNLTYDILLEMFANGVTTEKDVPAQLEFEKIILELKTEQENTKQKKVAVKKGTIKEWIEHIDYYFKHGTFQSSFPYISKNAFSQQFQIVLQSENAELLKRIEFWLNDLAKKNHLLRITNDQVLNQLIKTTSNATVRISLDFFKVLLKMKSTLSLNSRTFLSQIEEKKGRLILGAYIKTRYVENEILPDLFKNVQAEFGLKNSTFFDFLLEIKSYLGKKYRQSIEEFLATYSSLVIDQEQSTKVNQKIIEDINQEILDYTYQNEEELWRYWIHQQLQKWAVKAGIEKQDLLFRLKQSLTEKTAEPRVISFVQKLSAQAFKKNSDPLIQIHKVSKGYSSKTQEADTVGISQVILKLLEKKCVQISKEYGLFSEWSQEIIHALQKVSKRYNLEVKTVLISFIQYLENKTEKKRLYQKLLQLKTSTKFEKVEKKEQKIVLRNRVEFVLIKGRLPWWVENYNLEDFNDDFLNLWNTKSNRKELTKLVLKRIDYDAVAIDELLDKNNVYNIWKVVDRTSGQVNSALLVNIDQLLKDQILPLGLLSIQQYQELNKVYFPLLKQSSLEKTAESLIQIFENWIVLIGKTEAKILLSLTIELIDKRMEGTNQFSTLRKKLEDLTISIQPTLKKITTANKESEKSINAFLSHHPLADQWKDLPLPEQLKRMIQVADFEMKKILSNTILRESLINELNEKDLFNFVLLSLNVNQQQYLRESLAVIELSDSFVSVRELNILKRYYFQLVLLKMGTGGFAAWNISNWARLLIGCIESTLGKVKSREVVQKVSEKLLLEAGDDYKKGMQLLDEMHLIILTDEDTTKIQNEEEDYRKLGEVKSREFLDPIFITNAGLIILSPYLGMLFERCGLMKDSEYVNKKSKFKAVHLLQYAATGESGKEEHGMVINKILCGMTITEPIEKDLEITDEEKEIVNGLLTAITQQWKPLSGTSIEGLQESFLQREGKLEEESQYFLKIEKRAFDILLDQITWNISNIKLSWMEKNIVIEWR